MRYSSVRARQWLVLPRGERLRTVFYVKQREPKLLDGDLEWIPRLVIVTQKTTLALDVDFRVARNVVSYLPLAYR